VSKPKGGRGKKAPYETTVMRIPDPVVDLVEDICDAYRDGTFDPEQKPVTDFSEIRDQINEWRKQAKVGKEKLQNLLQIIYGVDVEL
jgi:hypothetical protein